MQDILSWSMERISTSTCYPVASLTKNAHQLLVSRSISKIDSTYSLAYRPNSCWMKELRSELLSFHQIKAESIRISTSRSKPTKLRYLPMLPHCFHRVYFVRAVFIKYGSKHYWSNFPSFESNNQIAFGNTKREKHIHEYQCCFAFAVTIRKVCLVIAPITLSSFYFVACF